jgi:hypothetical protein
MKIVEKLTTFGTRTNLVGLIETAFTRKAASSHMSDTTTFQKIGFFPCGSEPHCPVQDVIQDKCKGQDQDWCSLILLVEIEVDYHH